MNAARERRVRIGLHTGEALKDADKSSGKTVILASRIAAQAHRREILVSGLLKGARRERGERALRHRARQPN